MQGYENLFIKCAYEHIAQKMDQVSEAYPSGRLCGRANMTSYQEKKFQQFHHWCTSHVRCISTQGFDEPFVIAPNSQVLLPFWFTWLQKSLLHSPIAILSLAFASQTEATLINSNLDQGIGYFE